ncbi:putative peroxisomal NADH pyrophosphatase [Triangularia verruculosa]|uniref:NAD(+) diphosphatase n=1 Tax=Triangularia verruculosa TaxID=2587418 RepID=A0AAN6XH12_9PEZI|nr:putative peroxisomal NADH pyrophosphatase [Triangularia verruculosa]
MNLSLLWRSRTSVLRNPIRITNPRYTHTNYRSPSPASLIASVIKHKPSKMAATATPDLPILPAEDSHLTAKFGRETANYFSGSPLNRLSFLRTEHAFLAPAFKHPSASFLLMDNLAPLISTENTSQLAFVSLPEIVDTLGNTVFEKTEEELIKEFNSEDREQIVVFLGVDEKGVLSGHGRSEEKFRYKEFEGVPYFAVDVTKWENKEQLKERIEKERKAGFFGGGPRHMGLIAGQAAMYGYARALIDWNARTPFCAQCGQRTLSVNAGTKRICPPTDHAGGEVKERKPCATRGTVSNHSFPRTDPTVIMAIVSSDGSKILLGRQRRWPKYWYSTLAGFQEPGESIEEAVRREVWEESGVQVGRVVLHSSQPWPFPASLMIGAVGQALPGEGEKIYLGHDAELESAKWFPMDEVKEALAKGTHNMGEATPKEYVEGALRLPPQTAIANRLINSVVDGWWVASRM